TLRIERRNLARANRVIAGIVAAQLFHHAVRKLGVLALHRNECAIVSAPKKLLQRSKRDLHSTEDRRLVYANDRKQMTEHGNLTADRNRISVEAFGEPRVVAIDYHLIFRLWRTVVRQAASTHQVQICSLNEAGIFDPVDHLEADAGNARLQIFANRGCSDDAGNRWFWIEVGIFGRGLNAVKDRARVLFAKH